MQLWCLLEFVSAPRICHSPDNPRPITNWRSIQKWAIMGHHGGQLWQASYRPMPLWPSARAEVVCHSLLQWTTFRQNSPPWPVSLGWPYMTHCFIELDKVGIPVVSLVSFSSWWEGLAVGKTGSCSGGQGHIQKVFNPIFCWWMGLYSLPVVSPEAKQW